MEAENKDLCTLQSLYEVPGSCRTASLSNKGDCEAEATQDWENKRARKESWVSWVATAKQVATAKCDLWLSGEILWQCV